MLEVEFVLFIGHLHDYVLVIGQKLMMMGTADEIVKAPEKGPVFMEDLPEEEQVVAGHSAGLFNLKQDVLFTKNLSAVFLSVSCKILRKM
ncbi:hypothetical protein DCAR_0933697 [Daucus carota subsp. sativus]|uniref:Uncharacterized protein n=1 Tax=Daucus carota subsp. sativus TaxID=79200 RepID=A0AAF1BGN3_DAUCS|nr:hypothetical protein DCAR_0933697 [Daucus carota subsp. sativus]